MSLFSILKLLTNIILKSLSTCRFLQTVNFSNFKKMTIPNSALKAD